MKTVGESKEAQEALYQFLLGKYPGKTTIVGGWHAPDFTMEDVLQFSRWKMETKHDWIQWVFPTTMPSGYFPDIPYLTKDNLERMKHSEEVRKNLCRLYDKVLWFYKIDGERYKKRVLRHWVLPGDHNHRRLARVLECLRLFGMWEQYRDLCERLSYLMTHKMIHLNRFTVKVWLDHFEKE